ncbi:MAG: aminoacetone oxidase family FAD-binding enzyme [Bacteroidetes bacterium]|nr:MAG: aminoacetone oxidase family FAD-binding enzyme [Bacteroidota bacterium]
MMRKQLVVIGGGASGFFCAVNAARLCPELKVIILEKSSKLLSKVKISGGGRCNVTYACFEIPLMAGSYPRGENFVKKTFHNFFTTDTIKWFEEKDVRLKTEPDGRMFPVSNSSQSIIDCLLKESSRLNIEIRLQSEVNEIQKTEEGFLLLINNSVNLNADFVCVASGGYPKTNQFEWLLKTGHHVVSPVPSLFSFNMPGNPVRELMGVAVEKATVKIAGEKLKSEGPLLITHWGMSGPAILKLSAWAARELASKNYHFSIIVNWLPQFNEHRLTAEFKKLRIEWAGLKIGTKNPFNLPRRLWEYFLAQTRINPEQRWKEISFAQLAKLGAGICSGEFKVEGKTTYKEEFVTAGGIKLSEINHTTMESKILANLYFAGEVMDVDGITGGFNFQHAWTSGWIAGNSIAQKMKGA